MKIVEESPGRLIVKQRSILGEMLILAVVLLFAALAWLVRGVEGWLSLILAAAAILSAITSLVVVTRTEVVFDRVHGNIMIRQKSLIRDSKRRLALADVTGATLISGGIGGSTVALQMRPGVAHPTLPLGIAAMSEKATAQASASINRWLHNA
ncbi:MAG: hypothetical protein V4804_04010 [Pseudomonadota bacterium]|jgi:hypothetical protein